MLHANFVSAVEYAARAIACVGLGNPSLMLHDATWKQTDELLLAGYRPALRTRFDEYTSEWKSYYAMSRRIDGVEVVVFSVYRPALESEIPKVAT